MANNKLTNQDIKEFAEGKKLCFKESSMELARRLIEAQEKIAEYHDAIGRACPT